MPLVLRRARRGPRPRRTSACSTRLILLRHGVTDFTVARKLDGRGGADPDLNELGRQQAAAAAGAVRAFLGDGPVRVVSSSLARAVQTGSVVASAMGVELETDDDWDEQGFGDWDGKSIGLLTARYPDELARLRDDDTYARAGESHRDMAKRVLAAMERASGSGTPVVVATHRSRSWSSSRMCSASRTTGSGGWPRPRRR